MRKYILIIIILAACNHQILSQPNVGKISDSLRIDSLKKVLPSLRERARIDCLNLLAEKIRDYFTNLKVSADSSYPFAMLANTESRKIVYKYGMAKSLLNLGMVEHNRDRLIRRSGSKDSAASQAMKKYIWEALQIAEELKDNSLLAESYYWWGLTFFRNDDNKEDNKKGIEGYETALKYYRILGNKETEGELCTWLCMRYSQLGQYEKGIDYCQQSLTIHQTKYGANPDNNYQVYLVQQSIQNMADLYKAAGDYETALTLLRQCKRFSMANNNLWLGEWEFGEVFHLMGKKDSASYYLRSFTSKEKGANGPYMKNTLGKAHQALTEYDAALKFFQQAADTFKNRNQARYFSPILVNIGRIYSEKGDYKMALKYLKEGFAYIKNSDLLQDLMNSYELFSKVYYKLKSNDSAYIYLLKYTTMKDSLLTNQFLWRLNQYKISAVNERKEAQIALLNKDNKIQQEQLKQEAQLKKFLIFGLTGLLAIGFFVFRTLALKRRNDKLSNERTKADLQQKVTQLEMKALRAQMNPHFIFNCLSSINRFILKNEPDIASDYLSRFSRLIRMVLLNSQRSLITLEDELDMLTIYLDMERLRFKNTFDYHIVFTNRVDAGAVFIPPLLLQPFCENAIWHGLRHLADPQSGRNEQGMLNIELSISDKILNCIISDNGIGRRKAEEIKSKSIEVKKSMGLKITTERLALLNDEKDLNTFYEIGDLQDENGNATGTKVILKISSKEPVEETL